MKLPECFASSCRYKNNGFVQPEWEPLFVEVGLCKNTGVGNVLLHRVYKTVIFSMHPLGVVFKTIRTHNVFYNLSACQKVVPQTFVFLSWCCLVV